MIDQLIGSVRELIEHGSLDEAKNGIKEVSKLSHDISLPFLYSIFTDRQYPLCHAACDALVSIGNPAFNYLRNLYPSSNENQKYWIIRTLVRGKRQEIEYLSRLVDKENEAICAFMASQLANVREVKLSVPILIKLFKKQDSWLIKKNCAQSFVSIGKPVVPYLKKLFTVKDRDLKFWVIRVLAEILGDDLYPFLRKMLKESPGKMGYYALVGLDKIDSPRAIKLLVKTLGSEKWLLKEECAEILKHKGKKAIPHLKKAFKRSGVGQQYWIIRLIAEISGEKSVPFLQEIIGKYNIELRYFAISAIGRIPCDESISTLVDCLGDRAWIIRKQAAKQLSRMGTVAVPAIQLGVSDLREDVAFWCVKILSDMAAWNVELFLPLLSHPDKSRRVIAVRQSSFMKSRKITKSLVSLLRDPHWAVRKETADALVKVGFESLEELIPHLLETDVDSHLEYWSSYVVKNLPFDLSTKFLSDFLTPSNSDEQIILSIKLLSSIPCEDAWNMIVQRYVSADKFFRKRLKEKLIELNIPNLVKPLLKALKRLQPEICAEVCEIITAKPDLEKFKTIRQLYSKSSEEQAVWLVRALASSSHPAKFQFLIDMLTREKREKVKKEVIGYLGSIKEDGISQVMFKIYMTTSDEDKMRMLNLYYGKPGEEMIKELIFNLPRVPKQQGFWIAKFLQKYVTVYNDMYRDYLRTSDVKTREWLQFILK